MKLILFAVLILFGLLVSFRAVQAQAKPPNKNNNPEPVNTKEDPSPNDNNNKKENNPSPDDNTNAAPNNNNNSPPDENNNSPPDSNENSSPNDNNNNEPTRPENNKAKDVHVHLYNVNRWTSEHKQNTNLNTKQKSSKEDSDEDEDEDEDYYDDFVSAMLSSLFRKRRDTSDIAPKSNDGKDRTTQNEPSYIKNMDLRDNVIPDFEDMSGPGILKCKHSEEKTQSRTLDESTETGSQNVEDPGDFQFGEESDFKVPLNQNTQQLNEVSDAPDTIGKKRNTRQAGHFGGRGFDGPGRGFGGGRGFDGHGSGFGGGRGFDGHGRGFGGGRGFDGHGRGFGRGKRDLSSTGEPFHDNPSLDKNSHIEQLSEVSDAPDTIAKKRNTRQAGHFGGRGFDGHGRGFGGDRGFDGHGRGFDGHGRGFDGHGRGFGRGKRDLSSTGEPSHNNPSLDKNSHTEQLNEVSDAPDTIGKKRNTRQAGHFGGFDRHGRGFGGDRGFHGPGRGFGGDRGFHGPGGGFGGGRGFDGHGRGFGRGKRDLSSTGEPSHNNPSLDKNSHIEQLSEVSDAPDTIAKKRNTRQAGHFGGRGFDGHGRGFGGDRGFDGHGRGFGGGRGFDGHGRGFDGHGRGFGRGKRDLSSTGEPSHDNPSLDKNSHIEQPSEVSDAPDTIAKKRNTRQAGRFGGRGFDGPGRGFGGGRGFDGHGRGFGGGRGFDGPGRGFGGGRGFDGPGRGFGGDRGFGGGRGFRGPPGGGFGGPGGGSLITIGIGRGKRDLESVKTSPVEEKSMFDDIPKGGSDFGLEESGSDLKSIFDEDSNFEENSSSKEENGESAVGADETFVRLPKDVLKYEINPGRHAS